jgi:hypothetical protein
MADLFVYIELMLLLFTSKPGTKSAAELRSGPATELGSPHSGARGCPIAEP